MKNIKAEELSTGVILFKNVIDIDQDLIIPYLFSLKEKALQEDYTIIYSDQDEPLYAVNRSGHRYDIEDMDKSCSHIMHFADQQDSLYYKFFETCENTIYQCLLRYIEKFPMAAPCLWWKTQGHVVAYSPGSSFGLHADNDVNYQPGAIPDQQLATRNVIGAIMYFNDSVDELSEIKNYEYVGGEIIFPYLNVTYKPKAGDLIMFPSNFLAAHEVKECFGGYRYGYVGYFAHGSSDESRGINIREKNSTIDSGQVWIPELFDDYFNYIKEKYGNSLFNYPELTRPIKRSNTSNGTTQEVEKERSKNANK
jgi:predicted 2-oxoglutarate/Fe(II)-dependent dioxygenase YbiX